MAKVYRRVGYMNIEEVAARHATVQKRMGDIVRERAEIAAARLAEHRHDGHARITTERGDIDHYLVLDDERGLMAARSIETGRASVEPTEEDPKGSAGMEGLWLLHDAMGLKRGERRRR